MQNLKKYLLFIFTFFICLTGVSAGNTVTIGEELVTLTLDDTPLTMHYLTSNNNFLYSYNPEKEITLTEYQKTMDTNLNIDMELIRYLKYIAYFGYGYQDRVSKDWYIATQVLIWQNYLQDKKTLEFEDAEDKIKYEEKMQTILNDIEHLQDRPSFTAPFEEISDSEPKYIIKMQDKLVLNDENNLLSEFDFSTTSFDVAIKNNNVTLTPKYPTTDLLSFQKKIEPVDNEFTYELNGEAILFTRGFIIVPPVYVWVKVLNPVLTINLLKDEFYYPSLKGAKYGIYYQDNADLIEAFTVSDNEKIIVPDLGYGKFYIEEIQSPSGYEKFTEKIFFEGNIENDYEIDIPKKALLKTFKFKYNSNNSSNIAEFTIYDTFNNPIKTFKTNEDGEALITLSYGNFIIRNNNPIPGFSNDDINFEVNENMSDMIEAVSKETLGTLNLTFIDNLFKEPINGISTFKIAKMHARSLEEDTYEVKDGAITLDSLPLGDYLITDITIPNNYKLDENNEISFSLTEEEQRVDLTIYSELKTGSIFIKEIDKLTGKPVINAIFRIYNSNDELLWEEKTNEEGIIEILNVPLGNYYLKKVLSLDDNIEDKEKIELEIKEDVKSSVTLSNRITEEVPITSSNKKKNILVDIALTVLGELRAYAPTKA